MALWPFPLQAFLSIWSFFLFQQFCYGLIQYSFMVFQCFQSSRKRYLDFVEGLLQADGVLTDMLQQSAVLGTARLAQSVEHGTLNLKAVGSLPQVHSPPKTAALWLLEAGIT